MGNQSSKGNSATKGEVYHMLLVGETGSGKTSFLNLVYNVQLVHKLGFATSAKQFRKYNKIKFENPSKRPMESATIGSELYEVRFEDMTIGIIDTPGFGDTRGFEIDKQNVKDIVDKVNGVEYINCICFVINGRQARVTPQFQYVVSEISAVLPKMSVMNMVVLLTNTRDETEANIDMKEVTSFLGGEIMQENIFCLENPYCKLEKLRNKKPDLPCEEIATGLKDDFSVASKTLEAILTSMMRLNPVKTCDFMTLFVMKEAVEKATLKLMIACQNQASLIKVIGLKKQEIDEALKMKTLNQSFKNTYTVPKIVIVYTEDRNTLCGADGCYSNCHLECILPKQGDHKVKMCDKDIIKLCHCMDEVTNICSKCHHSYDTHYHMMHKFEKKDEQVTYFDEAMKERYEMAEKSVEDLSTLMKDQLDSKLKMAMEEVVQLSEDLINKVNHFEEHASAASYAKLIECQLMLVEQRIKATPADGVINGIMSELVKTKEQLLEKLQLLTKARQAPSASKDINADINLVIPRTSDSAKCCDPEDIY
eukprot:Em0003g226a